jgi:hypothetical protein
VKRAKESTKIAAQVLLVFKLFVFFVGLLLTLPIAVVTCCAARREDLLIGYVVRVLGRVHEYDRRIDELDARMRSTSREDEDS